MEMDSTLFEKLKRICGKLLLYRFRDGQDDGLVVYACCVRKPVLEQNMRLFIATAKVPGNTTIPQNVTFGDPSMVWLDIQFHNINSREEDWATLCALPLYENNLSWNITPEFEDELRTVSVRRVETEIQAGYTTFECHGKDRETTSPLAYALVLNRHTSDRMPLMLKNTTGMKAQGTLLDAVQEWKTRIVPPTAVNPSHIGAMQNV